MSKIEVLEGFGREVQLRKKWLKMWTALAERILSLPKWMQDIVLEDIRVAVQNRVDLMEIIQRVNSKR